MYNTILFVLCYVQVWIYKTNFKVGVGIGYGAGVEGGYNARERNIGAKVESPAGSYGFKVGCTTEICVIGCFTVKIC